MNSLLLPSYAATVRLIGTFQASLRCPSDLRDIFSYSSHGKPNGQIATDSGFVHLLGARRSSYVRCSTVVVQYDELGALMAVCPQRKLLLSIYPHPSNVVYARHYQTAFWGLEQ